MTDDLEAHLSEADRDALQYYGQLPGQKVSKPLEEPVYSHSQEHQDALRAEVNADVQAFLDRGGKIEKLPYGGDSECT